MTKINLKSSIKNITIFTSGALLAIGGNYLYNKDKITINLALKENKNSVLIAKTTSETVNLDEVTNSLKNINANISFDQLNEESKKAVIQETLVQKILLKNALKNDIHKNIENEDLISKFVSLQIKQEFIDQEAKKVVTDAKIKETYSKLVENLKDKKEYKISHILVKGPKEAYAIYKMSKKEDFANLANKYSIDKQSAKNGGELGYVLQGTMIDEIEDNVAKLKVNKISKPFKSKLGWHLVKLQDKRDAITQKFEEVENAISNSLLVNAKKEYISKLLENNKIEFLLDNKENSVK